VWGDGYTAALINFTYLATAVMTTDEVIEAMKRGKKQGTSRGIRSPWFSGHGGVPIHA
jgi:hypothetical protein